MTRPPTSTFPADTPCYDCTDLNGISPYLALSYLKEDLNEFVGTSGRPVVLIHHYGFDSFSINSWSEAQREDYWKLIANYNIITIITGHKHLSPNDSGFYVKWDRPTNIQAQIGPDYINTFIAGSASGGAYLRFNINQNSLKIIRNGLSESGEKIEYFDCTCDLTKDSKGNYLECKNKNMASICGKP